MTKKSTTGAALDEQKRSIVSDGFETIATGAKTVTSAGTAEIIVDESTPARFVMITTDDDNTGRVAIGGSGLVASTDGGSLGAGETVTVPVPNGDLANLYLDVTVSGEGVKFTYWN